jgi:hypothetical protein
MLHYVSIHTTTRDSKGRPERNERNVTLAYSSEHPDQGVELLGNIEHCTRIVVDQKLVDDLQKLVNLQELVNLQAQA